MTVILSYFLKNYLFCHLNPRKMFYGTVLELLEIPSMINWSVHFLFSLHNVEKNIFTNFISLLHLIICVKYVTHFCTKIMLTQ